MKLEWKGEQGTNNKKFGKWKAFWNQRRLQNVEGYYENGSKIGLWNELFKNYFSQAKVFETGQYQNNYRVGKWKYIYKKAEIGGGKYSNEMHNMKIGQWIELDDEFRNQKQVIYNGEYNCGNKVGSWDICFRQDEINKFTIIGGGQYDEKGNGLKNGLWIDLDEEFNCIKQVIMTGNYENGKKTGRWNIKYRLEINQSFSKISQLKIIAVVDNIIKKVQKLEDGLIQMRDFILKNKQLIMVNIKMVQKQVHGQLTLEKIRKVNLNQLVVENIKKVLKLDNGLNWMKNSILKNKQFMGENIKMVQKWVHGGGGEYQNGIKIGQWTDLDEEYNEEKEAIYKGNYQNGQKIGKWDICFRYYQENNGGGFYSKSGIKVGQWTDLDEGFQNHRYRIIIGKYKNGKKFGLWDTFLYGRQQILNYKTGYYYVRADAQRQQKYYWQGSKIYDEFGNQISKQKKYYLISLIFQEKLMVFLNNALLMEKSLIYGIFMQKCFRAIKINKSNIISINDEVDSEDSGYIIQGQIKGGFVNYDSNELVVYRGQSKNNHKIGRWDINLKNEFQPIGGGEYQKGIKIGQWADLDAEFDEKKQVIYKGNYLNGIKYGPWEINFRKNQNDDFTQIGGGQYNYAGNKIGQWTDLNEEFNEKKQAIYKGKYQNGIKQGPWVINFRKNQNDEFKQIGGGEYQNGIKIGQWTELDDEFNNNYQVTQIGQYNNYGDKIGCWIKLQTINDQNNF
ncbi:unnamed protein product [Paramecium pentaurelia]|uniref:Uncharacterized protein n=1 Tax=Paramecium pentaurelia TaxID=43138 RepID=A0A8S1YJV1_9CILI|nr:unnamed protein product [Paramecium pentaurelia]